MERDFVGELHEMEMRAINAKSRVRELEADCAAYRDALDGLKEVAEHLDRPEVCRALMPVLSPPSIGDLGNMIAKARRLPADNPGRDLLRRLEKLERVAEAAAELSEVAQLRGDNVLPEPPDDPKRWSARMNDAWGELDASLAALDGDGK